MQQAQLQRYRRRLEDLRSRTRSNADSLTEQVRTGAGGQAGGGLSNAPLHLGDSGTEEFLHDVNAALVENQEYHANEVTAALDRIENGSFGVCEQCGQPVAKERLDAIPFTRFCVSCAEANEDLPEVNINAGRPQNPADTIAPEGEMQEDRLIRPTSPLDDVPGADPTDVHAAGTPGGGTSLGGLAGSNTNAGEPEVAPLQDSAGSGNREAEEQRANEADRIRPVEPLDYEESPSASSKKNRRTRSSK